MTSFALRGLAWSLGLFGLIRLGWFEALVVLPFTVGQARVAASLFGAPVSPIDVTLACSGADALALCAGVILAYPAAWRLRVAGASIGTALILALNTLRIGVLGRAAGSPVWFEALHLYVWPAVLVAVIAGYVYSWMRFVNQQAATTDGEGPKAPPGALDHTPSPRQTRLFILLGAVLSALFIAASPLYLESSLVLTAAASIARAAAFLFRALGVTAAATANVLSTSRGAFLVTQECIVTPLIPIYAAAIMVFPSTWPKRAAGLLLALPLFFLLGIARLLVVALPAALLSSPLFLVHAFYQLLTGVVVVLIAARTRHGASAEAGLRALLGIALGVVFGYLLHASGYARLVMTGFGDAGVLSDPQGALEFLPAFQTALYVAFGIAAFRSLSTRSFLSGLALLGLSQAALFAALHLAADRAGVSPHVRDVRAWSLLAPLLVYALLPVWPARASKGEGEKGTGRGTDAASGIHGAVSQ